MSRTPDEWSPESDDPDRWSDPTAFYITFLSDHDQAAAGGRPLLTPDGVEYLQRRLERGRTDTTGLEAAVGERPRWDAIRRRLWLGGRLLKAFRQPAPHQTALVATFEARGWPAGKIADPLAAEPGEEPTVARHRLYETVKNLNRQMPPATIRFHVDGDAVWWESASGFGGGAAG